MNTEQLIQNLLKATELIANVIDCPGFGGNVSVKTDDGLYIKASGTKLRKDNIKLINEKEGKPSIEIGMHKNSKYRYVLHYHPMYLIPFITKKLAKELNADFIEYATPGDELARFTQGCNKNILLLQNHGVVVQSDDYKECINIINRLKESFMFKINDFYCPDDYVMMNNEEQILANVVMKYLIQKNGLTVNVLSKENLKKLDNSDDEKYRKEINKGL